MASFNIEINQRPTKGSNEHKIRLRITINQKHSRINLLYSVIPRHFNPNGKKSNYIRSSHTNHKYLNEKIEEKISQAKEIVSELEKKKKTVTAIIVKELLNKPKAVNFIEFAEKEAAKLNNAKKIGSYKKYNVIIKSIKRFAGKASINFDEITPNFLTRYETYLKDENKSQVTIHGYTNKIRALINKAIQQEVIEHIDNPFRIYKLKQGKSLKDRLTIEEITTIEELKLTPDTLISHVRNAFLFSFYNAGIRISDLLMLTWDNVKNGKLVYTMFKTNRVHSMTLKVKPLAILEQYKTSDTNMGDYIFPFFKNHIDYSNPLFQHNQIGSKTALINKYLKEVAKKAEIIKNVTTHTARHSFADIARKKTDNIYNLSKTLGHSSIKVTEAYLASFDEAAVDETLNNVFD